MRFLSLVKHILITTTLLLVVNLAHAKLSPSGIVFFGDSLSDMGNNPKAPYTNAPGIMWPQVVAEFYGIPYAKSGLYGEVGGNNWAVAGAMTSGSFGVLQQVSTYLAQHPTMDPNQIILIWAGPNDFLQRLIDKLPNPDPLNVVVTEAVNNLVQAYTLLQNAGAKNIIILNMLSLSEIPLAHVYEAIYGRAAIEGLGYAVNQFNLLLSNAAVRSIDVGSQLGKVFTNPEQYGISNTNSDWLSCEVTAIDNCDPNKYLFWDLLHPTNAGHKIIAEYIIQTLETMQPANPHKAQETRDNVSAVLRGRATPGSSRLGLH